MKFSSLTAKIISLYRSVNRYINLSRIDELKKGISDFNSNSGQCASVSYFPFVGWIYPLVIRKNDPHCIHHVKQGFVFFIVFILVAVILNLVNIFAPLEWRHIRLGMVVGQYVLNAVYFIFCVFAVRRLITGKNLDIKPARIIADRINL